MPRPGRLPQSGSSENAFFTHHIPELRPSGQPALVQRYSRRFCFYAPPPCSHKKVTIFGNARCFPERAHCIPQTKAGFALLTSGSQKSPRSCEKRLCNFFGTAKIRRVLASSQVIRVNRVEFLFRFAGGLAGIPPLPGQNLCANVVGSGAQTGCKAILCLVLILIRAAPPRTSAGWRRPWARAALPGTCQAI